VTEAITITPNKAQFDFMADLESKYVFMFGGKGSGKSYAGMLFMMHMVSLFPNSQGILMWNTLAQARGMFRQDIEPMLKSLGWPYRFSEQTMDLKVLSCVVHFRSAEPDANRRIESLQYHWGWADEASFYPSESLTRFVSRIRKGKALVRISSMPDDPSAFVYKFADDTAKACAENGIGCKIYETNVMDNPDAEFRKDYVVRLKSTYQGAELERYLEGKRVSLEGLGAFRVPPVGSFPYDPHKDLYLSWDFNVEYRAVSAWQEQGITPNGQKSVACVKSWRMAEPTIFDDAEKLCDTLKTHKALIILDGDASGDSKTPMATVTAWGAVKQAFMQAFPGRVRYVVASHNPNVQTTIQCANWAMSNGLVGFDQSAKDVHSSLVSCRLDKSGSIDKSRDNETHGARSHEADTARYAMWHFFKKHFPGNRQKYFFA
jgi:hypothetical protein